MIPVAMGQVLLKRVSTIYSGGVKAVDNVDLPIRDQEFVVSVGSSGCGRSTTLRLLAATPVLRAGS